MFRLHTLGGIGLERSDGTPTGLDAGRLPLALLAMVAAAGPVGMARDQLLAYLWPESDTPHARHALSQLLYALRQQLVGKPIVTGTVSLALDAATVHSDLAEFREALATGEVLRAATIYRGPFLDGFHLVGHPEFAGWVEETRGRLHQQLIRALERSLQLAGDDPRAVEIAQALVRLDPYTTTHALALMALHEARQDPGAAYATLERHVAALGHDLELPPPQSILDQMHRLRALGAHHQRPQAVMVTAGGAVTGPAAEPPRSRSRLRWSVAVLLLGVLGTGIGLLIPASPTPRRMPLLVIGQITDAPGHASRPIGELIRRALLLSTGRLGQIAVAAPTSFDAGSDGVTVDWRAEGRTRGAAAVLEGQLRQLGAGQLELRLTLTDPSSGRLMGTGRFVAGDPLALVDSATGLVASTMDADRSTTDRHAPGTASWAALSFWQEGTALSERGDLQAAYRMFEAALREDSAFAVAAFGAFHAAELLGLPERDDHLARAVRHANTAPLEARLYILGHFQTFSIRGRSASLYADSAIRLFPDRPQAHILAGQVAATRGDWSAALHHGRTALEIAEREDDRTREFWRPCAACGAAGLIAGTYSWMDSLPVAERTLRAALQRHPESAGLLQTLAAILQRQGRGQEAREALDSLAQVSGRPGIPILPEVEQALRAGDPQRADRLLQQLLAATSQPIGGQVRWLRVIALRDQGRWADALRFVQDGRLPDDDERIGRGRWYLDPLLEALVRCEAGEHDRAILLFRQSIDSLANEQPGAAQRAWRLTHVATALAAARDTGRLPALADTVERLGGRSLYGRDRRLHHYLRGLLESARGDDAAAVAHHRQAMYSPNEGFTRVNLELGRALLRLDRPTEAVAALAPALRGSLDASNLYVTRTELHEALAEAFAGAGIVDSARAHYAMVLRAWASADASLGPRVAKARTGLQALAAAR